MEYSDRQQALLRQLPNVDELLQALAAEAPHGVKVRACREALASARTLIQSNREPAAEVASWEVIQGHATKILDRLLRPSLRPLVNATGVVIHTNLGRSLLPAEIWPELAAVAGRYSNLEYNLEQGKRGSRYDHVEDLLCELTGAEAALVVNNNAAAVLITLETLARGREVIVSRGELVEIGGSFRIPDVMARSGAVLREVGATNRTHLHDYERNITEETALLLKVHQSNFQILGFTKTVSVSELAELGRRHGLPVVEDLGSGTFIDFTRHGLVHEPTVQEALAAGASLVTFSGDKLMGGPQAGIIVGRHELVDRIKKNPLNRAVRIDKLTLAALEGVLRLYRNPEQAVRTIPTLRMLTLPTEEIKARARRLRRHLRGLKIPGLSVEIVETESRVGGGALPLQPLPSLAVAIRPAGAGGSTSFGELSVARLEKELRSQEPPVIVRIEKDFILFDVRTLLDQDISAIAQAMQRVCEPGYKAVE